MDRHDTHGGMDRFGTDRFGMNAFFDRMRRSMMGPSAFDDGMRSGLESTDRRDTDLTVNRTDDGSLVIADKPGFETDEIDLPLLEGSDDESTRIDID
jgi:HSP20 family molecular chaperone IbpA